MNFIILCYSFNDILVFKRNKEVLDDRRSILYDKGMNNIFWSQMEIKFGITRHDKDDVSDKEFVLQKIYYEKIYYEFFFRSFISLLVYDFK
jgi:hypothetical protein